MNQEVLLILGMFAATFSVRWLLFGFANQIQFPDWFNAALKFVPVAVLTALFIPMMLKPQGEWWVSVSNPYLIGGIVAAVIAWKSRNLLLTIFCGLGVFILLKSFL